ncbi:MAG: response regulator [Oculatellaceae cyanobacterium bins.114]|nr:response regulator [Oculatellaceae cyanobacterium bins.114]
MKILLVEDDVMLGAALTKVLEAHRYAIDLASDGQIGLELATTVEYDLILLDVQIPKLDGISLCRQLRSQGYGKPILLLTANDSDAVAVAGFDAGADDYISKPCASEVLLARIRTLLRRSGAIAASSFVNPSEAILTWGKLSLDLDAGRVTFGEQVITLTATEYNLLELFLRNPDRIFSRSAILDRLWGFDDAPTDRAIVTHVKDLRKKLKAGGLTEEIIETVYGMGYRLKPAPLQSSPANALENEQTRTQPSDSKSAIAQVLERFRGVFDEQVAVLERATAGLLAGSLEPELQQAARQEAHKLAGSLASFGYPEGSKLARSIEHLLIHEDGISAPNVTRFAEFVAALQQDLSKAPVTSVPAPLVSAHSYRILVIDDDAALTEQLKAAANAWGFRLKSASNLAIARSLWTLATPDVILLDLSFPTTQEDGLSLLQELTQALPNLPVIVFTGRDSLADRLAASRLGARQFLHKPATTEQIFQAIARVLSKPQLSDTKVLIVDDDLATLAFLSNVLTPWGLDITTLSEPQHFWKTLLATSPNLILLDLEMPHINGLELCQVVRQDAEWGDLPILVVTAHTDAESLQHAFAAGADDFISKPVLGPELVTRVLSRIERHRLHQKPGSTGSSNQGRPEE